MRLATLAACCLAALSCPLSTASAADREILFVDFHKMATASRLLLTPHESPAPVFIIDHEMIHASGFSEIHELLRLVPGFQVGESPSRSPLVVNHGLGDNLPRRVLVMIDGQSVQNPLWGNVEWQDLPLRVEDIDRIEVVRGPNQATYGAAAFQGVINIITRDPLQEQGNSLTARYGDQDMRELYLRGGGEVNGIAWRLSGSAREATNFPVRADHPEDKLEAIERYTVHLKANYRPNFTDEWELQAGLSRGQDQRGDRQRNYLEEWINEDNTSRLLQLRWGRLLDHGSRLSINLFHSSREEESTVHQLPIDAEIAPLAMIPIDTDLKSQRNELQIQYNFTPRDDLEAALGAEIRHDAVESDHYLYGLGEVDGLKWQLFGDMSWNFADNWLLNLGGMLEKHYNTELLFSPRIALNHTLARGHTLRMSGGRGYRAPTIFEEHGQEAFPYSGGLADVDIWNYHDLDPESLSFAELGYLGEFDDIGLKVNGRLFIEEYAHYIDVESCILDPETPTWDAPVWSTVHNEPRAHGERCPFAVPEGYARPIGFAGNPWRNWQLEDGWTDRFGSYKAFIFYNSDKIRIHGADLTLDWRHADLGRFILSHAITRIAAHGHTDRDAEVSAPNNSTSLLWMKRWPGGWHTSAGLYRVGYMKWPAGDDQRRYTKLDLRLAKTVNAQGSDGEFAITLQNLNGDHGEVRPEYRADSRVFASLKWSWR